ncbi:MAG: hypothetical protein JWL59_2682 [Chthoniobacteraceae bacterium]|nr:hypothetical protein [Chthoniobacteraceae bacterium]
METEPPESASLEPQRKLSAGKRLFLGTIAGDATLALLFLGLKLLAAGNLVPQDLIGVLTIPSLLLVPVASGLMAAYLWRTLTPRLGTCALQSLWMTLIAVLGAYVCLGEGAVCLVIGSPVIYLGIFAGTALGRTWFKKDGSNMQLCIVPLVAMLGGSEMATRTDQQAVVVDEILIHASPAKVWPHILAFPDIPAKPDYWIFQIGLPYPMSTTNGGNFVGADRQCIFSDGIVLKEKIAELVPEKKLTFDIVEQPTHPEAYGHITLHRGRFELRDNGDGTTTLIGSSWYTLHVRPLFYFDWWTRDMTRAVHLRVMEHVRQLSEA